jgi:hypothetical protein
VREGKRAKNCKKKYNPNYLIEHLGADLDLDKVLDEW